MGVCVQGLIRNSFLKDMGGGGGGGGGEQAKPPITNHAQQS